MASVYFLISLFAAAWVFYDAKSRGKSNAVSFLWCLGTQLLLLVFLPAWLLLRPNSHPSVMIVENPVRCAHCGR